MSFYSSPLQPSFSLICCSLKDGVVRSDVCKRVLVCHRKPFVVLSCKTQLHLKALNQGGFANREDK